MLPGVFFVAQDGRRIYFNGSDTPQVWDNSGPWRLIHVRGLPCGESAGHDLDIDMRRCRRCGLSFQALGEALRRAWAWDTQRPDADLPVSDHGLAGAIPLPEPTWVPATDEQITDVEWATQNRKINDLLACRRGT